MSTSLRRLVIIQTVLLSAAASFMPGAVAPQPSPPSVRVRTGEIGGAKFTIASADTWNRQLLIFAPGYRPEEAPLAAELPIDDPANARLLADGWMLAATSYRRNGLIVRDAIADINALRDHIERIEGTPGLIVLLGQSMGGAIVTLIAENEPGRYHGAVAIGAALQARDPIYPVAFTGETKFPVIFLTNRSELAEPAAYVERAAQAPVPPVLWRVERDGHVNVNHAERLLALDGLINWITTNTIERVRDATVVLDGPAGGTVSFSAGAVHGAVGEVSDNFGNIFTTFRPRDLAAIGLAKGMDFILVAGGKDWRVRYGSDYGDVARGEWVAFDRAEGVVMIARNYANAATTAGVKAGDPLTIRTIAKP